MHYTNIIYISKKAATIIVIIPIAIKIKEIIRILSFSST